MRAGESDNVEQYALRTCTAGDDDFRFDALPPLCGQADAVWICLNGAPVGEATLKSAQMLHVWTAHQTAMNEV